MRKQLSRPTPRRLVAWATILTTLLVVASHISPASAGTGPTAITSVNKYWGPLSTWNGFKVYLSAPRHADSGSRGECLIGAGGLEENKNGRLFGWYAANGSYYLEQWDNTSATRNLRGRSFKVMLSRNTRDDGYLANRTHSNNWGSDVHVAIHSNADPSGCGASSQYVLTMYKLGNTNSQQLATKIRDKIDPITPGGKNMWDANLAELNAQATHRAYLEVSFHTNFNAQSWMGASSKKSGWRLGWAIDNHLGYP